MSDIQVQPGEVQIRGSVGILNVGDGDTKLSFNPENPEERKRAAGIVAAMLKAGYAIVIEDPPNSGTYRRIHAFDEAHCQYIISDTTETDLRGTDEPSTDESSAAPPPSARRPQGRRGPKKRVEAGTTRAVSVGRSAGG